MKGGSFIKNSMSGADSINICDYPDKEGCAWEERDMHLEIFDPLAFVNL